VNKLICIEAVCHETLVKWLPRFCISVVWQRKETAGPAKLVLLEFFAFGH